MQSDRGNGSEPPTAWFLTSTSMPNGASALARRLCKTAGHAVSPKPSWPAVTLLPSAATTNFFLAPPFCTASAASFASRLTAKPGVA